MFALLFTAAILVSAVAPNAIPPANWTHTFNNTHPAQYNNTMKHPFASVHNETHSGHKLVQNKAGSRNHNGSSFRPHKTAPKSNAHPIPAGTSSTGQSAKVAQSYGQQSDAVKATVQAASYMAVVAGLTLFM